ncbi:hypothetical protein PG997_004284 [Apiospora hydei]|uniref:Kelch repeat protein n=1 Tax=Apiospora hydei TaxID=1337664 RepID=A0ABR1X1L2_9PEZI
MLLLSRCSRVRLEETSTSTTVIRQALHMLESCTMLLLVLVVAGSIAIAHAQQDPVAGFCRRFGHQTTVIDRKLYIDGGFINYDPLTNDPTNYTNTYLSYLDLDHNGSHDMPQLYANLTKDGSVPSVHGGVLWGDDVKKRFYLFGGEYTNTQQQPVVDTPAPLWAYDISRDRWELVGHAPPNSISGAVSYGAGVSVSERGEGYYYGGWLSNSSVPGGGRGPGRRPRAWFGIRWIPKNGATPRDRTTGSEEQKASWSTSRSATTECWCILAASGTRGNGSVVGQPMDEVHLYNIGTSKWYVQHASGDVPEMRRRFCAGATWAQDQSSYNIYLYGGLGFLPNNEAGFDDVYILSLPSFTWTKMYPAPGSNITNQYPHNALTCNVIDGAQMLIMGGSFPLDTKTCDARDQFGTHGLDMGEQTQMQAQYLLMVMDTHRWFVYRKNITSYIVPQLILDEIGGNPQGGATKTAPSNGFDQPDLKTLMMRRYTAAARTPTGNVSQQGGGLARNAIIGIAVGCGGAALLASIVGCCCLGVVRRRRKLRLNRAAAGARVVPPGIPNSNNTVASSLGAARISASTRVPSLGAVGSPSPTSYYYSPATPVELAGSEGMHELHDRRQYGTPHLSLSSPESMMIPPSPKYMDHDKTARSSPPTTTTTIYSWSRGGSPVTTTEAAGAHTGFSTISPLTTTPTTETMQQPQQQQQYNNNGQTFPRSWLETSSEHSFGPLNSNPVLEQQQHQDPAAATTPQAAASTPLRGREQPRVQARDGGISKPETDGEGPRRQTYYHS